MHDRMCCRCRRRRCDRLEDEYGDDGRDDTVLLMFVESNSISKYKYIHYISIDVSRFARSKQDLSGSCVLRSNVFDTIGTRCSIVLARVRLPLIYIWINISKRIVSLLVCCHVRFNISFTAYSIR